VEGGELAEERAGEGSDPVAGAGERQDAEPPQRDGDGRLRQPGGPADQRLGGVQQRGVAFDERAAGGVQPDRCVQRDRAAADPDGEEVVVGRPPFPQPLGPADQRPQAWRVGVEVVGGGELGGRQLVGGGRHLRQVGEVAGSLPTPGLAGGPSLVKAQDDSQSQRGDRRAGDGDHQQRVPGSRDGEQERQRPGAAQHRHQVLQPCGRGRAGPRDRGWRRHQQLAGRERLRVGASGPVDQEGVGRWVGGGRHRRTLRRRPAPAGARSRICGQPPWSSRPGGGAGYGSLVCSGTACWSQRSSSVAGMGRPRW
jgi:hypothetical protein